MATLRLTRRGRVVLVLLVMSMLVLAGFTLGRTASLAAGRQPQSTHSAHPARHTVIVASGETLWSVASRIAPHTDPRLTVAAIESLNHLAGPTVEAGEQLVVPSSG